MVSDIILKLWKKNGWSDERIVQHCKEHNMELPKGLQILSEIPKDEDLKENIRPPKNGYRYCGFRPTYDVQAFLSHLPKREKSRFINEAIKFYMDWKNKK